MPRRQWLAGAISLAAAAGCRQPRQTPSSEPSPIWSDVPLRIVWVGDAAEAETLKRTWASISEQPLDVRLVMSPRQFMANASSDDAGENTKKQVIDTAEVTAELIRQAASADVLIYPLAMMSELSIRKRLMPLLEKTVATGEDEVAADVFASSERTSLPVALRVATTYSGERLAVALGGHLPSMLIGETATVDAIKTWDDYEALVQAAGGRVCEPSAAGWAGAMYLWRLASSLTATWLFERESLEPLFNEPEYVEALQQMARTIQKSQDAEAGRSPVEIYEAVSRGDLDAGIGFVRSGNEGDVLVRLANLPVASRRLETDTVAELRKDPVRWMVDPFMLAGSLASSCRQTAAADAFLEWIGGGQGSGPLFRNISTMIDTTGANEESSNDPAEQYRVWLKRQLASTNFVTTLQLPGATDYYAVLDQSVRDCVHGGKSAEDACAEITDRWSRLHRVFDLPAQQRAWRQAQGIG